uniref:Uncharacterized protein n=1 Tax=Manihot esculenta TaxID=3983 RepID=A0A2C9VPW8_MANES
MIRKDCFWVQNLRWEHSMYLFFASFCSSKAHKWIPCSTLYLHKSSICSCQLLKSGFNIQDLSFIAPRNQQSCCSIPQHPNDW